MSVGAINVVESVNFPPDESRELSWATVDFFSSVQMFLLLGGGGGEEI
jgi:hypothetical protein